MSGGNISVVLKDIYCSETIMTLRSLLKEDINLFEFKVLKMTGIDKKEVEKSLSKIQFLIDVLLYYSITLTTDNRPVVAYIVVYTSEDLSKKLESLFNIFLLEDSDEGNGNLDYQKLISGNGTTIPSTGLINYDCNSFAVSDFLSFD